MRSAVLVEIDIYYQIHGSGTPILMSAMGESSGWTGQAKLNKATGARSINQRFCARDIRPVRDQRGCSPFWSPHLILATASSGDIRFKDRLRSCHGRLHGLLNGTGRWCSLRRIVMNLLIIGPRPATEGHFRLGRRECVKHYPHRSGRVKDTIDQAFNCKISFQTSGKIVVKY